MKKSIRLLMGLCLFCLISAVGFSKVTPMSDPHSFSQPEIVLIKHLDLNLTADFERSELQGYVELSLEWQDAISTELALDSSDLSFDKAEAWINDTWVAVEYSLADGDPVIGEKLTVKLPQQVDKVRIYYQTQPQAGGLQWLTPEQTAGKQHPFMFSQSQTIFARTCIPLQDTPQVRFTYNATIKTPPELKAVMSAENDPSDHDGEYHFKMPQAIPSYLLAIGIGDLAYQTMSERTAVYAEPSILAAAAKEFEDTEAMMLAVEKRFGEYDWGRYDLLILPPSFPFGGMENPRLSFITPTVIAGDKSLVSLIAHELAHSWSGNLITNSTWADLWLNESFTTYLERRILEDVFGPERAEMERVLGYQDLQSDIDDLDAADTRLVPDLVGRHPDDVFSNVPYEKGQLLHYWMENEVGRVTFDRWLQGYFKRHAFQSISTVTFLQDIEQHLLNQASVAITIPQIKDWIEMPGLPETKLEPQSDAFEPIDMARSEFLSGEKAASSIETEKWTTHEWLYFLNNMPDALSEEQLQSLDKAFGLTDAGNNEVAHSWLKIAIKNDYQVAFERLENYLIHIGRRKLIVPLYDELLKHEGGDFVERVYKKARSGYHPLAQSTLDALIKAGAG